MGAAAVDLAATLSCLGHDSSPCKGTRRAFRATITIKSSGPAIVCTHWNSALRAQRFVFSQLMAGKGVERIGTAEGDEFDPNSHEAMSTVPRPNPDKKPGTVAIVWQVGIRCDLQW